MSKVCNKGFGSAEELLKIAAKHKNKKTKQKYSNRDEVQEIFDRMKIRYADNEDVLDFIAFTEQDLDCALKMERDPNYTGQTAMQWAMYFESTIDYWN